MMNQQDLNKIKHFIRVSFEIEASLNISHLQKKILLKLLRLWEQQTSSINVGLLASSTEGISERSVYRHLKLLKDKGWLKIINDEKDRRIKLITPSPRLIETLSAKLSSF